MWLVEAMGVEAFREKVGEYMGVKLRTAVEEKVSMHCTFSTTLVMLPHRKALKEEACTCDSACMGSPCHLPVFISPERA